jgi:hypothetical protein
VKKWVFWGAMTKIQKIISLLPFGVICGYVAASWIDFIFGGYIPSSPHYAALVVVVLNGALYFIRFRAGIWMTGAILLFGVANVISLSSGFDTFSVMGSPRIESRSFVILILYGIIDFGVYGNLFFKRESKRDSGNGNVK